VEEACTNIIKYAFPEETGKITISCELTDNNLVITIRDKGIPFNPTSVPLPDLEVAMENRQIGKLGLHLIRNLMDDVNYSFDDDLGNTLVMKKKLSRPKA
jgi:anti-sigma regulatory factor (Ser/Thr protein kinase)